MCDIKVGKFILKVCVHLNTVLVMLPPETDKRVPQWHTTNGEPDSAGHDFMLSKHNFEEGNNCLGYVLVLSFCASLIPTNTTSEMQLYVSGENTSFVRPGREINTSITWRSIMLKQVYNCYRIVLLLPSLPSEQVGTKNISKLIEIGLSLP